MAISPESIHSAAVHAASLEGAQQDGDVYSSLTIEADHPVVELFKFLTFLMGASRVEHVGFKIDRYSDDCWAFYQYTTTNDHVYAVAARFTRLVNLRGVVWL